MLKCIQKKKIEVCEKLNTIKNYVDLSLILDSREYENVGTRLLLLKICFSTDQWLLSKT